MYKSGISNIDHFFLYTVKIQPSGNRGCMAVRKQASGKWLCECIRTDMKASECASNLPPKGKLSPLNASRWNRQKSSHGRQRNSPPESYLPRIPVGKVRVSGVGIAFDCGIGVIVKITNESKNI